jgi:hypothetical protein
MFEPGRLACWPVGNSSFKKLNVTPFNSDSLDRWFETCLDTLLPCFKRHDLMQNKRLGKQEHKEGAHLARAADGLRAVGCEALVGGGG